MNLVGLSTIEEICPDCHMPDNCGDCDHTRLSDEDLAEMGLFDDSPGPKDHPDHRWATPVEVEEVLNGPGIDGSVWINGDGSDWDLAVPRNAFWKIMEEV